MPINVLGDVVISLDTAARQASQRRYTLLDESRVLLVHGVLHLLGYDHEEGELPAGWRRAGGHSLKMLVLQYPYSCLPTREAILSSLAAWTHCGQAPSAA